MATTTQLVLPARTVRPLALWHLLSLDAPTVAALWTWFIARANHIRLPLVVPLTMAIAVWMLYAIDRLLDARSLDLRVLSAHPHSAHAHDLLEARHLFHHHYRRAFGAALCIAAIALSVLLSQLDPAAIRLYLVEGTFLVAWFLILHATPGAHRLPKEIAVGLFFSAAICIPTVARAPALRAALLPSAFLFAALCSLNCLFIYAWEHPNASHPQQIRTPLTAPPPHPTTRLALAHLTAFAVAIATAGTALAVFPLTPACNRLIPAACAIAALLLLALDRNRRLLARTTLRAAADLALLSPLLLLPFLPVQ